MLFFLKTVCDKMFMGCKSKIIFFNINYSNQKVLLCTCGKMVIFVDMTNDSKMKN